MIGGRPFLMDVTNGRTSELLLPRSKLTERAVSVFEAWLEESFSSLLYKFPQEFPIYPAAFPLNIGLIARLLARSLWERCQALG